MSDDWLALSLKEQLNSNIWKARKHAYTELRKSFENSSSESACLTIAPIDAIIKSVVDSNLAAQESACEALFAFLQFGGTRASLEVHDAIKGLCEKALISTKAGTRKYALDSLLLMVELDSAEPVIVQMLPLLNAKLPKLVAATVTAINEIYSLFGCEVADYKLIIDKFGQLFGHPDKNVRAETTKLAITVRSYIGDAFETLVFEQLKPIQQKDLSKAFAKVTTIPTPSRILKSMQSQLNNVNSNGNHGENDNNEEDNEEDIEMTDFDISIQQSKLIQVDPWEIAKPVNILANLPADYNERINSPNWKVRLEVLKEMSALFKTIKIEDGDFYDMIHIMVKCLKDANIFVVITACEIIVDLANGIRGKFERYITILIDPLLDRTKEKKNTVTDALGNALDVCFKYCSSLGDILNSTLEHMNHKTPQIKLESMKFLLRSLQSNSLKALHDKETSLIMESSIKLLGDSQLPVRETAAQVIGTLMKLIGPRASKQYFEKIDKRHQKKISDITETVEVKEIENSVKSSTKNFTKYSGKNESIKKQSSQLPIANAQLTLPSNKRRSLLSVGSANGGLRKTSDSVIPTKRGATSPLKKEQNLTSKPLKVISNNTISSEELEELKYLRNAKIQWDNERKELINQIETYQLTQVDVEKQKILFSAKIEEFQNKLAGMNVMLKSKETRILRLQGDLEASRAKEVQLEKRIKMMESMPDEANVSIEGTNGMSQKISSLSIGNRPPSEASLNRSPYKSFGGTQETDDKLHLNSVYDFDDNDESWKRATAVTNDLKAKIQRMKARTRILNTELEQ